VLTRAAISEQANIQAGVKGLVELAMAGDDLRAMRKAFNAWAGEPPQFYAVLVNGRERILDEDEYREWRRSRPKIRFVRSRGRKQANQPRAKEFRLRLRKWKETPEARRVSLRALAAKLGTSHQLLSFYLRHLDD
jgi:hypothetical protein